MLLESRPLLQKAELVGVLEKLCETLELSDAQRQLAEERYEGVGAWLADAEAPMLRRLRIYLQGSTAIGTTVKPIGRNEHDVDLVCHMPDLGLWVPPVTAKKLIGDRLRSNGHYTRLLEEKPRCWRLNYANEFHMDITPSVPNPNCGFGGELVPDRTLQVWKPTNPQGYRAFFERRAKLMPRMRIAKRIATDSIDASVEPYPTVVHFKGVLRRSVQLAKRHRDILFVDLDPGLAPLSVIVTTLASRSYEYCVGAHDYESELDVLADIIRYMPAFIEERMVADRKQWFVWNETTSGENFAEKWNVNPAHAEAFFEWQARALRDIESLADVTGLDRLRKQLGSSFGPAPVSTALDSMTQHISAARRAGTLVVTPGIGLATMPVRQSTMVRPNTFFGAE